MHRTGWWAAVALGTIGVACGFLDPAGGRGPGGVILGGNAIGMTDQPAWVDAGLISLPSPSDTQPAPGEEAATGLVFRVGELEAVVVSPVRQEQTAAEALGAERVAELLGRLAPLTEDGDQVPFAFRPSSAPPPLTGDTLEVSFPPESEREVPGSISARPLQVLRHAPDGEVDLAPTVRLAFSLPMVPLGALDALPGGVAASADVPARLTPQPAGQWRWLDTRTLVFEPDGGRLPAATEYELEVPMGVRAATGEALAAPFFGRCATPAPRLLESWPAGDSVRRRPVMIAFFDQRIDARAVLPFVRVHAAGEPVAVRFADDEALAASPLASRLADPARAGTWIAVVPERDLPGDSEVRVRLAAGLPSAEGPRVTPERSEFSFRTHGPLAVRDTSCGGGDLPCRPGSGVYVWFTHPLDLGAFHPDQVRITPPVPGWDVQASGNTLSLRGAFAQQTRYAVRFDPDLRDTFGQSLGEIEPLTIEMGLERPACGAPGDWFNVLDPYGDASWSVWSLNCEALDVRLYRVDPSHWLDFARGLHGPGRDARPTPPGRLVLEERIVVTGRPGEFVETRVDLTTALGDGPGHVVLDVVPIFDATLLRRHEAVHPIRTWLQRTLLGVDLMDDGHELHVWANRLADGAPVAGARVTLQPDSIEALTGDQGLALLPLPHDPDEPRPIVRTLSVQSGDDTLLLPESLSTWTYRRETRRSNWRASPGAEVMRFYVVDDRGLYRPGETVHLKGYLRTLDQGRGGDVGPAPEGVEEITWTVRDSQRNEFATGVVPVNSFGAFDLGFELPPVVNLGWAHVALEARRAGDVEPLAGQQSHSIRVEEFRRPEYEVAVQASQGPHLVGGEAELEAVARYYAGGGLPGTEVDWNFRASAGWFTPPGRHGFSFGSGSHWDERRAGASEDVSLSGVTDGLGRHRVRVVFDRSEPPRPHTLQAEAAIEDVNRQRWAGRTSVLVHPAEHYVGLHTDSSFVERGTPLVVDAIVADLDGELVSGTPIRLAAEHLEWVREKDDWVQRVGERREQVLTSAAAAVRATFPDLGGGRWRLTAEIHDGAGRRNRSDLALWVSGGKEPPSRELSEQELTLVLDREQYAPGDTAHVLVQAPFAPAEGLLSVQRAGVVRTQRFRMEDATTTLHVSVEEGWQPGAHIEVWLVGATARTDATGEILANRPPRPAFARGGIELPVPPLQRTLQVELAPAAAELEPGAETTVAITVTDAEGAPVPGEVALIVVDEAVLALTGYDLADPMAVFYPRRSRGTSRHRLRDEVVLADDTSLEAAEEALGAIRAELRDQLSELGYLGDGFAVGSAASRAAAPTASLEFDSGDDDILEEPVLADAADGEAGGGDEPVRERSRFDALAHFAGSARTDADGAVVIPLTLPDSLTRYRVMALTTDGERRFGHGESTITARLPLMVRPSPPRFLNFGDSIALPVVLQNGTDDPMTVDLAVAASNAQLTAGAGRRVSVPARDRVEVRLPVSTDRPGTARFGVIAAAGAVVDAARFQFPVWTPATSEAFAVYGEIDRGAVVQPVSVPRDVVPDFGGLELTTSSTAVASLTDALLYLVDYPYGCAEQVASRVLAVAALRDVLAAFEAEQLPPIEQLQRSVAADIERLGSLQNDDGGFAYWRRGDDSVPFLSVHVALALLSARQAGYDVPADALTRSLAYLLAIETHIPSEYSDATRRAIEAFALNVRWRAGEGDPSSARRLLQRAGRDGLSLEALGWLLPVLADTHAGAADVADVLRRLSNQVTETASGAHFSIDASSVLYGGRPDLILHSSRRTDGVALDGLIAAAPGNELVPKLVRGLLTSRRRGHWGSTQENAFVLLALRRYFDTYESVEPDFVARAWLGERYAAEQTFVGRGTDRRHLLVPLDQIGADQPVVLEKQGEGRLYYRLGLRYAPTDLELAAVDRGFAVERAYQAVEDPGDVRRDEQGTWHVRAGATVRVRVTMMAPGDRAHVALVDPLPGGFEALNPALAVTAALPPDAGDDGHGPGRSGRRRPRWASRTWYQHQNLRDERAEAFSSWLRGGVYSYSYYVRVTTPGRFVVPPARAEEMYNPETFGRSATATVIVE